MSVNPNTKCTLHSVTINGVPFPLPRPHSTQPLLSLRTTPACLASALQRSQIASTSTIKSLSESTRMLTMDLNSTGCFDSVSTTLKNVMGPDGEPLPNTAQLELTLAERNWYRIHLGVSQKAELNASKSSFGSSFDSASLSIPKVAVENSFTLFNLAGDCSKTGGVYNLDQTGVAEFELFHEIPNISTTPTPLALTFSAFTDDVNRPASSFDCHSRTLQAKLRHGAPAGPAPLRTPYSEIKYALAQRDTVPHFAPNIPYTTLASPEIISAVGPNLIHAITGTVDTHGAFLDNPFVPSRGLDAKATVEVACPPGDAGHIKSATSLSLHLPLPPPIPLLPSFALHLASSASVLMPLSFGGMCSATTHPVDRFPSNTGLRGFTNIGPRAANQDCLGGTFENHNSISVSAPLPGFGLQARAFSFLSAGTLCDLDQLEMNKGVFDRYRVSAGVGAAIPTPMGRMEVSYSHIVRKKEGDTTNAVGLGINLTLG